MQTTLTPRKKSQEELIAEQKENARLAEIANDIPKLLGQADAIPVIRVNVHNDDLIDITFTDQTYKNTFCDLTGCKDKTKGILKSLISLTLQKDTWEDVLALLLLKQKLNELKIQEERDKKTFLPDLSLSIKNSSTKAGVVKIKLQPEYERLLTNALNAKYGPGNEPYCLERTSENECTLSMYKRGLKNFLSDNPALFSPIKPINEIINEYTSTSTWHPYYESRQQGIKVLEATKQWLKDFLDDNIKESVLETLHQAELNNPRWVESPETRQLVESSKVFSGVCVSPQVAALDTRIAERINEYQKNINAEEHAWFYTNESKRNLWQQKIHVLLEARACLFRDGYNGDLIDIENKNPRWIEGDYSGETRSLISDIKKEKGVSPETIALDNKISDAINTYRKYIDNENSSLFSINKDKNITLWNQKIKILTEAKNVIYSKPGSTELYNALLETYPDAWRTGSTTKVIVVQVKEFYVKNIKESDEKNNKPGSKYNPNSSDDVI